jgi:hypothetical protein
VDRRLLHGLFEPRREDKPQPMRPATARTLRPWLVLLLLTGCIHTTTSTKSQPREGTIPNNDEFWTAPEKIRLAKADYVNNETPVRAILGPAVVDRDLRSTIPVLLLQGGGFEEFRDGSISSEGTLVVMDIDRNTLQIDPVDRSENEGDDPSNSSPRQPTGSRYALESVPVDLAERFFQDLPRTTGRYRLTALASGRASTTLEFRVGPGGPAFDQELSHRLALIPDRRTLPPELLQEDPPWKPMTAPPTLPEGLRASILTESGRAFLEVDFALPEFRGERLHLESSAVLPSGNRPPDAVKWVHVLAAGEDYVQPAKVLLPVAGGAQDQLLRGHAKIDLNLLFSGMATGDFQSVYVFSGAAATGPLELPARKP